MPREHAVVKQRGATGNAVCIQALLLEPLKELSQSDVPVDCPAVPHGPRHVLVLDGLRRNRFSHGEEGECQIGKGVTVIFELVGPSKDLIELKADETSGHGGGGGNGRYDATSNELGFQLVHLRNAVVASPHVGQARYQVHVVVCIIVLLNS